MNSKSLEKDAIVATVQKYIDGIVKHNTDLISEAFHPAATMSSHHGGEFSIVPAAETIVSYMKTVRPVTESSPDFKGRVLSVDQKGTIATAVIAEDALEGLNFITYFHLHKVGEGWLITAKATYGEPV